MAITYVLSMSQLGMQPPHFGFSFSRPFQRSKKFSILIRFNPPNLVPNCWDNSKFLTFKVGINLGLLGFIFLHSPTLVKVWWSSMMFFWFVSLFKLQIGCKPKVRVTIPTVKNWSSTSLLQIFEQFKRRIVITSQFKRSFYHSLFK